MGLLNSDMGLLNASPGAWPGLLNAPIDLPEATPQRRAPLSLAGPSADEMAQQARHLVEAQQQRWSPTPIPDGGFAPEVRSYSPSFSERIGSWMQDGLMALGAKSYPAGHIAHGVRDLLGWTPLGVPMAVGDTIHAKSQDDMLGTATAMAGMIPGVRSAGKIVRNVADEAGNAAGNAVRNAHVLNVPYEAIPSRDSQHLAGIEKLPQDVQDKYSRSFNFGHGPGGIDTIYDALQPRTAPDFQMRQQPTIKAQGYWRLPDGSVQQNIASVARPMVGPATGNPTIMDPESARIADVAENLRAYGSVQDGIGGQLMTRARKVADTNTVRVPTPNGVTREQMSELNRRAKPYGLQDISNVGSDVNLTNFAGDGPTGKEISGYLHRGMLSRNEKRVGPNLPPLATAIREVVPDAGVPVRSVRTGGPYVDYSAELKAEPGSGAATSKLLGVLDKEPVLAERLNKSEQIPQDFLAMADRDQEFAAAHGLPMRGDVQNARRIIGEGAA
jgi:hypothetical protein